MSKGTFFTGQPIDEGMSLIGVPRLGAAARLNSRLILKKDFRSAITIARIILVDEGFNFSPQS
jgi:hypothetical protein